jgi:hypothetical protein
MKRSSITPRPKGTLDTLEGEVQLAQHLVDHARWQDSKGKNPSETGFGTQNPRLALEAARGLLKSAVEFRVDSIAQLIDPSSASRVVLSLLNLEGIRAREGGKSTSKPAGHYIYVTVTGEAGEPVEPGDTLTAKQMVAYSLQE